MMAATRPISKSTLGRDPGVGYSGPQECNGNGAPSVTVQQVANELREVLSGCVCVTMGINDILYGQKPLSPDAQKSCEPSGLLEVLQSCLLMATQHHTQLNAIRSKLS